ncbi:cation:proton antiporter [Marisediminicola sp. LYQ134]|uniref:cation:proton antiporter n=1 Tax=unclassified Marisediminicola TaxID=2618316 RepID=UPI003983A60C
MELLIVLVVGLLVIAGASLLGPRFGVASPLVLVTIGVLASLAPFVPAIEIEPEWILAGILPPLLYSAAVSMPAMNFRREFTSISGLSVVLVIGSAIALGFFFSWVIPGLPLAWGIALGAIVSPTDAVATSIVKRSPVSPRVVAILEGESLLNDATALVLLRTSIAAVAAAFSFWSAIGEFAFAVLVAGAIGYAAGRLTLVIRSRVSDSTINTAISFTVPFLASIPAELLGASGLVAAVVAGITVGRRAPRELSPQHRLSDSQNWRTVELVLEGAVFLTMGLGVSVIVTDVERDHAGFAAALGIAVAALALILVLRAVYVTPLLWGVFLRARRGEQLKPRIADMQETIADPERASGVFERFPRGIRAPGPQRDLTRFSTRLRRSVADIDYLLGAPLGWREGSIVVWAGMRGAVTVAAAQTLPAETPDRSLLVLIAYLVATLSLMLQGGTLARVIRWVKPSTPDAAALEVERQRLADFLDSVTADAPTDRSDRRGALARIRAQRSALLDARDDGTFDAEVLETALARLDAKQITIELHDDAR